VGVADEDAAADVDAAEDAATEVGVADVAAEVYVAEVGVADEDVGGEDVGGEDVDGVDVDGVDVDGVDVDTADVGTTAVQLVRTKLNDTFPPSLPALAGMTTEAATALFGVLAKLPEIAVVVVYTVRRLFPTFLLSKTDIEIIEKEPLYARGIPKPEGSKPK